MADTRKRILDAARETFDRDGLGRVDMRDVARATEVAVCLLERGPRAQAEATIAAIEELAVRARYPFLLGEVARLAGHREEARAHFVEAIEMCRRIDSPPFLRLSLEGLAKLDRESAPTHSPGAPRLARTSSAPPPGSPPNRHLAIEREGDVWGIEGPTRQRFWVNTARAWPT